MSSQILPTLRCVLFAAAFVALCLLQDVPSASEIFQATSNRFETAPFQSNPDKTIYQVQGPQEVYEWLTNVFVPQIYKGKSQDGDSQGFCTASTPCTLGQGGVALPAQCSKSLVPGDRNCASYKGSFINCCEECVGSSCDNFTLSTQTVQLSHSSSTENVAEACSQEMPEWLDELSYWEKGKMDGTSGTTPPASQVPLTFCPEREASQDINILSRPYSAGSPLMVATVNSALMARLSLKRQKFTKGTSVAFSNAYPILAASGSTSSTSYNSDEEDTSSFGTTRQFDYIDGGGYSGAGAFVSFVDFNQPEAMVQSQIADLNRNQWFDLSQGSFVVEMLLFNGNVNKFVHISFTFEHDCFGNTNSMITSDFIGLAIHDFSDPLASFRVVLYLIIVVCFTISMKNELEDMSADFQTYFSSPMCLFDLSSLACCLSVIIMTLRIVLSYTFLNFAFPLPRDTSSRMQTFEDLINLAGQQNMLNIACGINACLILVQAIVMLMSLAPQWNLVFNSLGIAKLNLIAFLFVLATFMLGFTFAGYYLFGRNSPAFSTFRAAFFSNVQMGAGVDLYPQLVMGDPGFAYIYVFFFYIIFIIVTSLLLSVVLDGYMKERRRLADTADKFPLRRLLKVMVDRIQQNTAFINRCLASLKQLVFGASSTGSMRVDYEKVAKLRDRRPTQPRVRHVLYAQRQDDEEYDISADVKLRVENPFYQDGMMHYFVEQTTPEGPAHMFQVKKDFRLVGIQAQGQADKERFRDAAYFQRFNSDPQQLLQDLNSKLPVKLEFEGWVKPASFECIFHIVLASIFLIWALSVHRTENSFNMQVVHADSLSGGTWTEYNPLRTVNMDSVDSPNSLDNWLEQVVKSGYACTASINSNTGFDCTTGLESTWRPKWALWAGSMTKKLPASVSGKLSTSIDVPDTPVNAALGLSIGYVPNQAGTHQSTIDSTVVLEAYNVGVMPSNHMRITLQVPCYQLNTKQRWQAGYPYIIDPVILKSDGCSQENCMERMIRSTRQCLDKTGVARTPENFQGASGVTYTFSKQGTFNGLGGVAAGLGKTMAEANAVLGVLRGDMQEAVSTVVEFVTYNSATELFTYNWAAFDWKATGLGVFSSDSSVFPLSSFADGASKHEQSAITTKWILFGFYCAFVLFFSVHLVLDFVLQFNITTSLRRPWYMCFTDFFLEDRWNLFDVASVMLNLAVIASFVRALSIDANFTIKYGFRSWTLDWTAPITAGLDTVEPFNKFATLSSRYELFTQLCAVNGLMLLMRLPQYFSGIIPLQIIMKALGAVTSEIAVLLGILFITTLSFVLVLHTRFGSRFAEFGNLTNTFQQLLLYAVKLVPNADTIDNNGPFFFVAVFTLYQCVVFILLNVLLATLAFSWKESRRDAQHFTLSTIWKALTSGLLSRFKMGSKQITQNIVAIEEEPSPHNFKHLDAEFWESLAVLGHISGLQESGKIVPRKTEPKKQRHDAAEEELKEAVDVVVEDKETQQAEATLTIFNFDRGDDRRKFLKVFKKAHMEIASQMCTRIKPPDAEPRVEDDSKEKRMETTNAEILAMAKSDEDPKDIVGIIEERQPDQIREMISSKLIRQLEVGFEAEHEQDSSKLVGKGITVLEEIWLDSLVTVLEEAGVLKKLQRFFLPRPMQLPKKPQEWGVFYQKKQKMELRLNLFLRWLEQESKIKQYKFLRDMADAKERVLKQQSLVLTDYLKTLDDQVRTVQEEIAILERKKASMRTHISPLL